VKVIVFPDKCVSAGQCGELAPRVFDQRDDDGTVVLLNDRPPENEHDSVRQAADSCPAQAIMIEE
jgi:ferredoxin